MKIVLVGGGSGGHFYPLIATAQAIRALSEERTLIEPQMFYVGPDVFDRVALAEQGIEYKKSPAGKTRRHFSILNILDVFKTAVGILRSIFQLFGIYPDVIFSTGGYAAFPTLFAARILRIPVIIYDADAEPGRVSKWSAKFARFIAVAHPDAASKFPEQVREKIARTGHPIRAEIETPAKEGGYEFLKLDPNLPTVFFMGGSLGAQKINETVLDALPELVKKYNVIHQVGRANLEDMDRVSKIVIDKDHQSRYRVFGLLNALALRMAAGISSVIVARAGSGTIFEVSSWGIPAILVPIPLDVSHDQTENAFSYARGGAAVVLEQKNLTPHLLVAEINRIVDDPNLSAKMSECARSFSRPQAAEKIAKAIVDVALEHTSV